MNVAHRSDDRELAPPPFVYRWALDLCAAQVQLSSLPIAILAPEAGWSVELSRRLPAACFALGGSGRDAAPTAPDRLGAIILGQPTMDDLARAAPLVRDRLVSDGRFCAVIPGPLLRFVPRWSMPPGGPGGTFVPLAPFERWLLRNGLETVFACGLFGAASVLLGGLAGLLFRAGRPDLADRCHYAARESAACRAGPAFAALTFVTGRRTS